MRLFAAVYPADEAIKEWDRFVKTAPGWPLRWVALSSLHVTVKFLGSVEAAIEQKVSALLERLANSVSPFTLRLEGGGVFPSKGAPSIFWTGLQGETTPLIELAHIAQLEFKTLGFDPETRPFQPHLTVARRSDKHTSIHPVIGTEFSHWVRSFRSHEFQIDRLSLVESKLGPSGSQYVVRNSFPFSKID